MIKVTETTYNAVKAKLRKGKSVAGIQAKLFLAPQTIDAIRKDQVEIIPARSKKEEPSDVFFRF